MELLRWPSRCGSAGSPEIGRAFQLYRRYRDFFACLRSEAQNLYSPLQKKKKKARPTDAARACGCDDWKTCRNELWDLTDPHLHRASGKKPFSGKNRLSPVLSCFSLRDLLCVCEPNPTVHPHPSPTATGSCHRILTFSWVLMGSFFPVPGTFRVCVCTVHPNPSPTVHPNPSPTVHPNPSPTVHPNPTLVVGWSFEEKFVLLQPRNAVLRFSLGGIHGFLSGSLDLRSHSQA